MANLEQFLKLLTFISIYINFYIFTLFINNKLTINNKQLNKQLLFILYYFNLIIINYVLFKYLIFL